MKRNVVGIAASLVLALSGMFVLVAYVRGAEQRVLAGERVVTVWVADQPIARGTTADALRGLASARQVPAKVRAEDAVGDLSEIKALVATVDLVPGEQLLRSRFASADELAAQSAIPLPPGSQRVTVALSPEQALGGLVAPGDLVGVVASFNDAAAGAATTHLVLNKILVTNVQGEATAPAPTSVDNVERDNAPTQSFLVTVAVDAASAERLIFAAEHGSVWLTLQSADVNIDGTDRQTIEKVLQ